MTPCIKINDLTYRFPLQTASEKPLFEKLSVTIPSGSRTLLLGANGVGKSTLLRLVAGQNLLPPEAIQVRGRSPFYDPQSAQDIVCVGADFKLTLDLTVSEILDYRGEFTASGVDSLRQQELIDLLGVDVHWHMNRVSEGQRRRVQLLLALRRPFKLLLLDEVTAHLDVVIRTDLLAWLKAKNEAGEFDLVYATHILDGLWLPEAWPTHLLFLSFEQKPRFAAIGEIPELFSSPLLTVCEKWIRTDLTSERRKL